MNADSHAWQDQYSALTGAAGLVDFSDRTRIEISGDDRTAFLHNFATNDIRKLSAGAGCEAFLTTVQGKVLAHVLVFSGPQSLVLETAPGQAEKIIQHLDRYLITEKVVLHDRTGEWGELLLGGPAAEGLLKETTGTAPPQERLISLQAKLGDYTVWLRRVNMTGPMDWLIDCRREDTGAIAQLLRDRGAVPCEQAAFHAARVENGFPLYGLDISEKNLAQEVNRDALAISFIKGCYLGQETVARIDALGHVNKAQVGVRFESQQVPPQGMELTAAGQVVGAVTSATFSPRLGVPLALAYVRRGNNAPGARLDSAAGPAVVVELPIERSTS